MYPLSAATLRTTADLPEAGDRPVELIERNRQWGLVLQARSEGLPSMAQATRAALVQALRAHYPQGGLNEAFLDELLIVQVRRLIDADALGTTLLEHGGSQLEESPEPAVSDERWRVVVAVTEAVGPRLLDTYKAAVREHLLAPMPQVAQAQRLLDALDAVLRPWELALDAIVASDPTQDAYQVLDAFDGAHAALLGSLTLDAVLPPAEGGRLGDIVRGNLPYWLRIARENDKQHLKALAQRLWDLQATLAKVGGGLDDPQLYMQARIAEYIQARQGMFIDPVAVKVETRYSTPYGEERAVSTLAQVVSSGPYGPHNGIRHRVVQAPDGLATQALDLDTLLYSFDPRAVYGVAVHEQYRSEAIHGLMFDCLDAALLHSALAGRLRGHLSEAGHGIVLAARDAADLAPGQPTARGLELPGFGGLSLMLFESADPAAVNPLVLYAPGKFDGQEWVELPSLRALAQEIGGWVKEDHGRLYLLEQLPLSQRAAAERYLADVFLKPAQWPADQDYRTAHLLYRDVLERLVDLHQANRLESLNQRYAPSWYVDQPLAVRQRLNDLNLELNLLQALLQRTEVSPESFVAFAKRTVAKAIKPYFEDCGVTEPVDPDTVLFEFQPGKVFDFTFSGAPGQQAASLMDLAVTGYDDNWGLDDPRMPLRSSIGQDLRRARAADLAGYIRSAYLGDQYERWVREAFLEPAADNQWRRQLFARSAALLLQRDALAARLKGHLDSSQHAVIEAALPGLQEAEGAPGLLRRVTVAGMPIAQVYVLGLPGAEGEEALVYCPGAPDCIAMRPYSAAFGRDLSVAMQLYYLERTRVASRDRVRDRLARIALGSASADAPGSGEPVAGFQEEYNAVLEDVLANVDHICKSRREVVFDQVLKGVGFASIPLGVLFPPLGFALDVMFIAVEVGRGYQAYKEGDSAAAVGFFVSAYLGTLFLLAPAAYHQYSLVRQSRALTKRYAGIYRGAPARQPVRATPGARRRLPLDNRLAIAELPVDATQVLEQGATQGLYRAPASATRPHPWYFIKQGKRYFQVEVDSGTVRVIDPKHPGAHYKMPVRQTLEGHWVFDEGVGLRGGRVSLHLGVVDDAVDLLPTPVALKPGRVAMAGEGIGAGFDPSKADNYLIGLETHGSVVASVYNPSTQRGALINIDHGIGGPIDRSIAGAVKSLGPVDPAQPLQGTLIGGDWLGLPGDILTKVNRALGLEAVLSPPAHWLAGKEAGGTLGLLLDLKTGVTLTWRFTSQGREAFYDPLRQYPMFGDAGLRQRAERFWARLRAGRWVEERGRYVNKAGREVLQGNDGAIDIPLHLLDG